MTGGLPYKITRFWVIPQDRRLPAKIFFRGLPERKSRHLVRYVGGQKVHVLDQNLKDDYLIVITNQLPGKALELYRRRWEIETLFAALKR